MGKRSSKSKRGSVKREKKESEEEAKIKEEEADEEKEEKIEPKEPTEEKKKKKTKKSKSKSVKREKKSRKEESKIKEEEEADDEKDEEKDQPEEEPTDEALRAHIRRLIPLVNLQNTGVKAFTKLLSKECGGADLKPRMKFIKVALSEAINALDDEEEEEEKKPRKTGLSVKKEISAELASFLGKGRAELVARTDVVKSMWVYIKANELQNPDNKREIFLDEKMKKVFGCDTFTMFTMNKYLGAHIHPFKPVDLTTNTTKKKKTGTPGRKRKKKAGDSDNDSGDDRSKKKRKPKKPGLQPPYRLSKELADLVGTNILPRPQVVKGIWAHIKKHDLQNPKDKREILCDGKLKKVMGGEDKVTMFNMNRYVTDHLLEKLDRSEYNHDETEAELQARDDGSES